MHFERRDENDGFGFELLPDDPKPAKKSALPKKEKKKPEDKIKGSPKKKE